jgi:bifunctional non-homologous end joining protein LigD
MPRFIAPCLATLREKVPSGDQWLHEIKFDGYRLQLHKRENDIRFFTRRGYDWTKRFSSLIQSAWYLAATHLILDGEVIVPSESGHSDFGARWKMTLARAGRIGLSILCSTYCTSMASHCAIAR